jgi:hypothetical protein
MRTAALWFIFVALSGIAVVLVRISNLLELAVRYEGAIK